MMLRSLEGMLYAVAVSVSCGTAWRITHSLPVHAPVKAVLALGRSVPHATTDSLADAIALIAAKNLFRPERASANDADAANGSVGTPPALRSPRPTLVLRGVVGGPPWDAIVDGVPGHAGSMVLRTGQRFGELEVRAFRHDTIFIRGMDTTWTLTLRRP